MSGSGGEPHVHVVELEAIYVDVEESAWCNVCMLPSALEFTQLIYNARTLALLWSRRMSACRDCETQLVIGGG